MSYLYENDIDRGADGPSEPEEDTGRHNDGIDVCKQCGYIKPCDCVIDAKYPWPADPSAMTPQEANDWATKRSRLRFALTTGITFAIGFGAGVYTISQTLGYFIDLK